MKLDGDFVDSCIDIDEVSRRLSLIYARRRFCGPIFDLILLLNSRFPLSAVAILRNDRFEGKLHLSPFNSLVDKNARNSIWETWNANC